MTETWKKQLKRLKPELPEQKPKKKPRKEVVDGEMTEIVRISEKVVRRRPKVCEK